MELEELVQGVFSRFQDLSVEEQEIVRQWKDTESAMVIRKILGPELGEILDMINPSETSATPMFLRA
jgi:hypothetical protein